MSYRQEIVGDTFLLARPVVLFHPTEHGRLTVQRTWG